MGEAAQLAKISDLARRIINSPDMPQKHKDRARRTLQGAQVRMREVSRGAAPGYRGNQSPGMGYGFGPDLPPRRNYGLLV
jgi:hypothetical protein